MSKFKEIRKLLSSLDNYEINYLSLQLSVAESARAYVLETGITHEEFADRLKIKPTKIASFLNGSFGYTLIHTSKMKGLWYEFHLNNVDGFVEENHTTVKIATEINDLKSLRKGDFVSYNAPLVGISTLTVGEKYQVTKSAMHHKDQYLSVFSINDDNGNELKVNCDSTNCFSKTTQYVPNVYSDFVIDEERKLESVCTGEYIIFSKEIIDLNDDCTFRKAYKVLDSEHMILNYKHLVIVDDRKERIYVPLTSDHFKPAKLINKKTLKNSSTGDIIILRKEADFGNSKLTVGNPYRIDRFVESGFKSNYIEINDDNNLIVRIATNDDNFELVSDFSTAKSINLCMKGDKIIFNKTGKFYPTKDNEHKMYFTFDKEYDVIEVCNFTDTSAKDYLTVFDDNGIVTEIYLFSTAFTRSSNTNKTIPEDVGNFKGKYLFTATHIEKGDILICVNETTEYDLEAKFTYGKDYSVFEEAKYFVSPEKSKDNHITLLDDNKKAVRILLTSKQFVLK